MPAETAGARTWLLGAVASWALATWCLALAGLGSRIERLPPDPSLLPPLPTGLPAGNGRPGPLQQYVAAGERPLFTSDRRPAPFVIDAGEGEADAGFDYVLTSVVTGPGLQVAILQPAGGGDPVRVRVGESAAAAPGWRLDTVEPRRAVFAGPDGPRVLELRVFDGIGGEPPTPVSVPDEAPAAPGVTRRGPTPTPTPATAVRPDERPSATGVTGDVMGAPAAPPVSEPSRPAPVPAAPPSPLAVPSPEAQVEAIRRRIEERRARLREEARQGQHPDPD